MTGHRWLTFAGTAVALVLGLAGYGWARGAARGSESAARSTAWPDNPPPPSAGLLRRLAESADAFRTGEVVYLVAQDVAPYYTVLGGYRSRDSAMSVARMVDRGAHDWWIYSTKTAPTISGMAAEILPGCYKNDRTTQWVCPPRDSTTSRAAVAMRASDVARINITFIRLRGLRPVTISIPAESISVAVFSIDAYDRFIVPYYTRLFGPARVAATRDSLLEYVRSSLGPGEH